MTKQVKKPTKKAAKKAAAPVIKLIDGQYKIKQLIRLKPDEATILEKYQGVFKEKTVNGTIERLLQNFDTVYTQNESRGKELNELYRSVGDYKNVLSGFKQALNEVINFNPKEVKQTTCKECGYKLDQRGECVNFQCDFFVDND